jgi:hypothetical protein
MLRGVGSNPGSGSIVEKSCDGGIGVRISHLDRNRIQESHLRGCTMPGLETSVGKGVVDVHKANLKKIDGWDDWPCRRQSRSPRFWASLLRAALLFQAKFKKWRWESAVF